MLDEHGKAEWETLLLMLPVIALAILLFVNPGVVLGIFGLIMPGGGASSHSTCIVNIATHACK